MQAHEDGPQYLQASHHLNDIDAKKEGFQDTYRPIDTSNKKSPNVRKDAACLGLLRFWG